MIICCASECARRRATPEIIMWHKQLAAAPRTPPLSESTCCSPHQLFNNAFKYILLQHWSILVISHVVTLPSNSVHWRPQQNTSNNTKVWFAVVFRCHEEQDTTVHCYWTNSGVLFSKSCRNTSTLFLDCLSVSLSRIFWKDNQA